VCVAGCGRSPTPADIAQFEEDCLDWQQKTAAQKFLDGPGTRDDCLDYLQKRTPAKIEKDQESLRWRLEQARKEWDDYEKRTGHR